MMCQACHAAEATHRVVEPSGRGQFTESRYCGACCKALAGLPDQPPAGLYTLVGRQGGKSYVASHDQLVKLLPSPLGE